MHHKPLTMHEPNSCRGRHVACDSYSALPAREEFGAVPDFDFFVEFLETRWQVKVLLDLTLSRLKWCGIRSIVLAVSKVEQMESELRKLSQAELRQIREWLDDFIEDELEFTAEFENSIQQSERDMDAGKAARVREPEGS
jgi:hypothetical protein